MSLESKDRPIEAERAELERVVEALAKWPRLSQLLRYMGGKYFSGDSAELNEYNIATEVLGRSKPVFNAAEDAIARVETHRLRKRLTEFYEKEGRDHQIQVTLPPGTYVPVFARNPTPELTPTAPHTGRDHESKQFDGTEKKLLGVLSPRNVLLAALIVAVALGVLLSRRGEAPLARLASRPFVTFRAPRVHIEPTFAEPAGSKMRSQPTLSCRNLQ